MRFIGLGANSSSDAAGYEVANSLRFNRGSSDYLSRTQTSGNRKTFTISFWLKRSGISESTQLIGTDPDGSVGANFNILDIKSTDELDFSGNVGGTTFRLITNRKFRDVSAWFHIVFAVDTTQATASNRMKIYVNGVQETSFSTETYPSQNLDTRFNLNTYLLTVGGRSGAYLNGYMAEVCLIDGQQLDPTSFGEFDEDTGIWKPIDVSGLTFGTNGFYLNVPGPSTGQNANGLGGDSSGNGNHFASSGLSAEDQSTDTPTNNFATWNPLIYSSISKTYSDGNLSILNSDSGNWGATQNNIGVSSGKWYMEIKITNKAYLFAVGVGFNPLDANGTNVTAFINSTYLVGEDNGTYGWRDNGALPQGGTSISTYTTNDILMIALDMDNLKVYFGKNGTWENSGNPTSGATGTGSMGNLTAGEDYFFIVTPRNGSASVNFGSPPYSISSGNSDGNGYGNFEYSVPSGYYALNSKNLAEYG